MSNFTAANTAIVAKASCASQQGVYKDCSGELYGPVSLGGQVFHLGDIAVGGPGKHGLFGWLAQASAGSPRFRLLITMDPSDPSMLADGYTRVMLQALVFLRAPQDVVLIGLGN